MELDWLIFPSPDTSYTTEKYNGELIFIPKIQEISNYQTKNINIQVNSDKIIQPEINTNQNDISKKIFNKN